jgi:nitroreductase
MNVDFFEAIRKRASVRAYSPCRISNDHLRMIVDAGRRAPSGYNRQPWEFIVIKSADVLRRLAKIQGCIGEASAAIAVVIDEGSTPYAREDAGAAIENMLLAAVALGYASLWVEGYVLKFEDHGKEVLQVPKERRLLAILPLGKPAAAPRQASKKDIGAVTHLDRYGSRWQASGDPPG